MEKLIIKNVNKKIKDKQILSDINLEFESGKIYGIVGKNGSGKTMLFRAILGLIRTDSGSIYIDNEEMLVKDSFLPSASATIENMGLYPELTGFQNLKYLARIRNKISNDDIYNAIQRVGLDPHDKRAFHKYSLGMKQRIILAQAFMEKTDIILLDEPTNGIDEEGVKLIRKIILEEKERGALVIIASHNSDDIDILCDKVYHMSEGRITC